LSDAELPRGESGPVSLVLGCLDDREGGAEALVLDDRTGSDVGVLVEDRVGERLARAQDLDAAVFPLANLHALASERQRLRLRRA
jgi:hypothetical protein